MNRIRELRTARGWRQSDLAKKLNTTPQSVARYETEERGLDVDTILMLCDIFGCTADYLLGRSSSPAPVIAEEDAAVLHAYHAAPQEIRTIVDTALAPYRQDAIESSTA